MLLKRLFHFFIFSNIWVAFCVLALALSSEILIETSNYKISQFVFFATIFTYNFQSVVRVDKGQKHTRRVWLFKNKIAIYLLMLVGMIMSIYRFIDFKSSTQIVVVLSGVLSVLYPFGIMKIPFTKIFIISLVWTISTMLLLVLENNIPLNQNVLLQLIARFLFVFAITIPFDIRDLKFDDKQLKTIPIIFGVHKSKLISISALFIAELLMVFLFLYQQVLLVHLIAIIFVLLVASIFIIKSDINRSDLYYSFWVEGLSLFFYIILGFSSLMF
ncbi:MAG: hypothetical protein H8E84_00490 [Flavobacteriales bacterium]|nr:hypothetical protein [Flavobacteriales bacterium]